MKNKKWIWITALIVFLVALVALVIGINYWFRSGNVRSSGDQVRVDLSGQAYIFDHETRQMLGVTMMTLYGETQKGNPEVFDGWMNIMNTDYMNQYDGTLNTTMGVMEGDDGYMEIHVNESCTHLEETDRGTTEVVTHSCKYSYEFYVHPDKQDFLVARVKDSYAVYPVYIVMAPTEEEATRIYHEFVTGEY